MNKTNLNPDLKLTSVDKVRTRANVNIDKFRSIAREANEEEIAFMDDLTENADLYKASKAIAMKVKRALRLKGWTQAQLATELDVDPAVVSKSLNGKANLELKTIVKLEKILNINIIDRSISQPATSPIFTKNLFQIKDFIPWLCEPVASANVSNGSIEKENKYYFILNSAIHK